MTSDLGTDDVVVCIASPQVISTEGVVGSAGRVAASSAAVELGRRLLLAARAGDTAKVLDLMAKGAPFTTDWLGTSPLHLAATNNHADTCAVLLRAGVSRDSRTKVDRTPLHMAAYAGHADVVRLLLQHAAALDCRDMLRMTPLHWAAQRGHAEAAAALLTAGCELAPRSKFGRTPRQLAAAASHHDVVALLDAHAADRENAERQRATASSASANDDATDADDTSTTLAGFHPIHRLQEIKATYMKAKTQQEKTSTNEQKTETNNNNSSSNDTSAAQLLRRHGITLLPADDGSTVLNALQSGRTVVLSDAGKLMLKESSPPGPSPTPASPAPPAAGAAGGKGLKLFTLNNKLLLNKSLGNGNITNVQLSQVKFVQLKDKLVSPKKTVPLKLANATGKRRTTPVKIIVNKNNYKLLNEPRLQPANAQPGVETTLRAQLAAARKAIAALTAELASCKARLALLERQHDQTAPLPRPNSADRH